MKKVLAISAVLLLIPFSAFGFQSMRDGALANVICQAGFLFWGDFSSDVFTGTTPWGDADGIDTTPGGCVGAVDAIVNGNPAYSPFEWELPKDVSTGTVAWGDTDGVDGNPGGYVGMIDTVMKGVQVRPRTDWAFSTDPADAASIQYLTVELLQDPAKYGGNAYVRIQPGAVQISMSSMVATAALADFSSFDSNGLDEVLGVIGLTGLEVYLPGDNCVEVCPCHPSGVALTFGLTMETIDIATLYWGDLDGIGAGAAGNPYSTIPYAGEGDLTSAGYIGLANTKIRNLSADGQLLVDVLHRENPAAGEAAFIDPATLDFYRTWIAANPASSLSNTFIRFALNDIRVGIESMTGEVVLGPDETLRGKGSGVLGNFYVGNVSAKIRGWVDVFTHGEGVRR